MLVHFNNIGRTYGLVSFQLSLDTACHAVAISRRYFGGMKGFPKTIL